MRHGRYRRAIAGIKTQGYPWVVAVAATPIASIAAGIFVEVSIIILVQIRISVRKPLDAALIED
eukprot:3671845-Ditylum_brightwellii.AAC.1